ncbi:type I-E CRISPR-associated endoribonuclease Cas2e (plasmid) [Streptomyces sp. NBC_00873]|uniref:type I-E CRISPR-associated endoribonuclease Cas2e n=1 Tax=Streptomyces sp. NBC_00873 TaxID=2975852 RepID=UPI002F91B230|nr:type I-E CRISPR-associated endoribonuclease Cas2e [Streptomyces sp. NBC_00873]
MSTGTTVVILISAPPGLRGHLTRWFVEAAPGIYVGTPNTRIRDRLWTLLAERIHNGQAIMIEPAPTEQGWSVRTAGQDRWTPADFDGLTLMARPRPAVSQPWRPETK